MFSMKRTAYAVLLVAILLVNSSFAVYAQLPGSPKCKVAFISQNLTSNRSSGLPNNRLQATLWYDGDPSANPTVGVEYTDGSVTGWLLIGGTNPGGKIDNFGVRINTREYDLGGCELTGNLRIAGTIPNGVIDGVAIGLYHKNAQGRYRLLRSQSNNLNTMSDFVGAWPIGYGDAWMATQMPQVTDPFAFLQARTMITGAKYLPDGPGVAQ
ncbi:MAG: hypothetical protein U0350_24760 [Caldilineaceae bacterium]